MAWFENYQNEGKGLRESINDTLQWSCSESCTSNGGLIDRANATFFVQNAERFPWVRVQTVPHAPYGGYYGTHHHLETSLVMDFVIRPEHKEVWGEFLEIMNNLSGYPIIDEYVYSEVEMIATEEAIDEIARDEDVDPEMLREVLYDHDVYSHVSDGDYIVFDCDMSEMVREASRKSQTWSTHYYGGKYHTVKDCSYCAEFGVEA